MYVKAKTLLEDDEDLKAAAALVTAYQKLLSRRFGKEIGMWGSEGHQTIEAKSKAICEAIHASAKQIQPNCMVGKMMGHEVDIDEAWNNPYTAEEMEREDEYDWQAADGEFTKVIWARFGRYTVQYNLNPCKENEYSEEDNDGHLFGQMALLVYAKPDNEGKPHSLYRSRQIFLAKNEISWKRKSLDSNCCFSDYCNEFMQHEDIKNTEENVILGLALCLVAKLGNWWPVEAVEIRYPFLSSMPLFYIPFDPSSATLSNIHSALSLSGIRTKKIVGRRMTDPQNFERIYNVHFDLID